MADTVVKCPHCGELFVIDGSGNIRPLPSNINELEVMKRAEELGYIFGEEKAGGERDGKGQNDIVEPAG